MRNLTLNVGFTSLDGNPDICLLDSCAIRGHRKNQKFFAPLLASAGLLLLLIILVVVFYTYRWKRKAAGTSSMKLENRAFTYSEVVNMTNNFQNIIGNGGSGIVYHGRLQDGTLVAVKILNPSSTLSFKLFRTEAELLTRIHHKNLVSLVGYCEEGENMALIYEFVANGNLHEHLSEKNVKISGWKVRLQMAIDAAQGLDYIHIGCKPPIIHRDMKPSNILLDDNLNAKISDFGISRPFPVDTESALSTDVAGTYGYLDPEYYGSQRLNEKSDVYSFGLVLLELITGRPSVIRGNESAYIITWVTPMLERGDIHNIVDKRLEGNFSTNSAWKFLEIAMSCVSSLGIQRPHMNQVLTDLKDCLAIEMSHGRQRDREMHNNGNNEFTIADAEIEMKPSAR